MLIPKGYTNTTGIENYILDTIKDYFKPQVEEWIAQMEGFVEKETGRIFIADTVASEKVYDGNGKTSLFVEECIEKPSKLTIDSDEVSGNDFLAYPANELPKSRIKLKDNTGLVFTKDEQNIKVEAKWGYSVDCPADISFAVVVLVAGMINYANPENKIKQEKLGDYWISYNDPKGWEDYERAKQILKSYSKITI